VDPRPSLDDLENRKFLALPGLELRPLGRPVRSHSLYRLRYPGIRSIEKSDDFIGNWTQDLPAFSIVPQPTTLPRAPNLMKYEQ
jgi:hypothetical protein